jgi:hypothetical protein
MNAAALDGDVSLTPVSSDSYLKTFLADTVPAYLGPTIVAFTIGTVLAKPDVVAASWSYIGLPSLIAAAVVSLLWRRRAAPQRKIAPAVQFFLYGVPSIAVCAALGFLASITVLPEAGAHLFPDMGMSALMSGGMTGVISAVRANKKLRGR